MESHIRIREATLRDYYKVYRWLYFSDFSNGLNKLEGIDSIPLFKDFKNDYNPYFFDGTSPEKGRSYIITLNETHDVGHISYTSFHLLNGITEFDIWLKGTEYTGKGIGTIGIKLLAEKIFDNQYNKIIFRPSIKNGAAIKSYKKAGFQEKVLIYEEYYKPEYIELYGDGDYGKGNDLFLVLEKR